ncbi:hypothetical protein IC582_000340 [Cucumis melo]
MDLENHQLQSKETGTPNDPISCPTNHYHCIVWTKNNQHRWSTWISSSFLYIHHSFHPQRDHPLNYQYQRYGLAG